MMQKSISTKLKFFSMMFVVVFLFLLFSTISSSKNSISRTNIELSRKSVLVEIRGRN